MSFPDYADPLHSGFVDGTDDMAGSQAMAARMLAEFMAEEYKRESRLIDDAFKKLRQEGARVNDQSGVANDAE